MRGPSFELTAEQRFDYQRTGLLALRAAICPRAAGQMADALWRTLERLYGVKKDAPETWTVARPSGLGKSARTGAYAAMARPTILGALDSLLGSAWIRPRHWGLPLATFPDNATPWDVPYAAWHLDCPATRTEPAVGRLFVLLAPVRPMGGGTVVVTGSHRIAQQLAVQAGRALRSADVVQRMRAEFPWFAALCSAHDQADRIGRFMRKGAELDGVFVRVTEMTGDQGDAYLMHPCLVHAASPNAGDRPRLMLTQWIEGAMARPACL